MLGNDVEICLCVVVMKRMCSVEREWTEVKGVDECVLLTRRRGGEEGQVLFGGEKEGLVIVIG